MGRGDVDTDAGGELAAADPVHQRLQVRGRPGCHRPDVQGGRRQELQGVAATASADPQRPDLEERENPSPDPCNFSR